jgi:hypothetical protein
MIIVIVAYAFKIPFPSMCNVLYLSSFSSLSKLLLCSILVFSSFFFCLVKMSVRSGELPPSGVGAANSEVAPHGSTVREEDGAQGRAREGVQGGGAGAGTHGEKAEAKESALVVEAGLPGLGFVISPRGILVR